MAQEEKVSGIGGCMENEAYLYSLSITHPKTVEQQRAWRTLVLMEFVLSRRRFS